MRLTYHPLAEVDLIEAALFYDKKVPGLGAEFLEEIDLAVQSILRAPDRWRIIDENIRRVLLKRFPYGIYYRLEDDLVRILVVKHHRRHPDYGKSRN